MTEIPSPWMPPKHIRPIALGLLRHEDALRVMRVVDAAGKLIGLRPPGGGVEFGERASEALQREFREDCDVSIEILGSPDVFENLYRFNGAPGHEICFVFPIASPELRAKTLNPYLVREDNGLQAIAEWVAVRRLLSGEFALFPPGLLGCLTPPQ